MSVTTYPLSKYVLAVSLALIACSSDPPGSNATAPDAAADPPGSNATAPDAAAGFAQDGSVPGDTASWLARPEYCDFRPTMDEERRLEPVSSGSAYGRAIDLRPGGAGTPCQGMPGVEVCLYFNQHCTVSDDEGFYVLTDLPPGEKELTFVKDGYVPVVRQLSGSWDPNRIYGPLLLSDEHFPTESSVAQPQNPSDGSIVLNVIDSSLMSMGRIKARLDPPSGTGPIYTRGTDDPAQALAVDTSLTATERGGLTWFLSVRPGDYSIDLTWDDGTPLSCTALPMASLGADDQGRIRTRVRAGLQTNFAGAMCSTPP